MMNEQPDILADLIEGARLIPEGDYTGIVQTIEGPIDPTNPDRGYQYFRVGIRIERTYAPAFAHLPAYPSVARFLKVALPRFKDESVRVRIRHREVGNQKYLDCLVLEWEIQPERNK